MEKRATLCEIDLPEIGLPALEPEISRTTYLERIDRIKSAANEAGYKVIVIYGDREHCANLRYLTGFDPRFEEALCILNIEGEIQPLLLVGNEGYGYAGSSPIRDQIDVELYQSLSLLGQDRSKSRPLREIMRDRGIGPETPVGTVGWKYFSSNEFAGNETVLEIPSYLADLLRELTGGTEYVRNANPLLMDSQSGLRIHNELVQLAWNEFAGSHASNAVRSVILGVHPGMSEYDAASLMGLNGIPQSCHPMLSAGPRAYFGMCSPSSRTIERGEPFTTAVGLWGALTSRAGFLVSAASDLKVSDYVDKLVAPYFAAIAAWYERIGIGVTGGELYEVVHSRIGEPFYGVALNPGHQIHLDEWVNSPIYRGSNQTIDSGMALQVDVIPATGGPYFTTNIEDGILIADSQLREKFQSEYPEAWKRIEARRKYMGEVLGIRLKPEVLPTSSIPAWLPPFILDPTQAMAMIPN